MRQLQQLAQARARAGPSGSQLAADYMVAVALMLRAVTPGGAAAQAQAVASSSTLQLVTYRDLQLLPLLANRLMPSLRRRQPAQSS